MSVVLRQYQEDAVERSVAYLTSPKLKRRNGLVVAPTGSGKSLVIAAVATRLPGQSIVFQPSAEILDQNAEKLAHYGYRASVFSASRDRREIGGITLATIGSVIRHVDAFRDVKYALVDECHLVNPNGDRYREFFAALPDVRVVGLTATPYRLASNMFGSQLRFLTRMTPRFFNDVVHQTPIRHLVDNGFWTSLAYRETETVDRDRLVVNTKGSEYTDESVQLAFDEVGFVGALRREVERELDEGRKNVLVFTRFVDEARRLADAVPGAAVVTADTPVGERRDVLAGFKRGRIRVVANVGIVALGFDYPELECVILGRPSISLALYYQQVGRIVRPHPEKARAHVVDMVGLVRQFGRVEDLRLTLDEGKTRHWVVASGERPLTNVYFAARDGRIDDEAAKKAQRKRSFFARRAMKGRR